LRMEGTREAQCQNQNFSGFLLQGQLTDCSSRQQHVEDNYCRITTSTGNDLQRVSHHHTGNDIDGVSESMRQQAARSACLSNRVCMLNVTAALGSSVME